MNGLAVIHLIQKKHTSIGKNTVRTKLSKQSMIQQHFRYEVEFVNHNDLTSLKKYTFSTIKFVFLVLYVEEINMLTLHVIL